MLFAVPFWCSPKSKEIAWFFVAINGTSSRIISSHRFLYLLNLNDLHTSQDTTQLHTANLNEAAMYKNQCMRTMVAQRSNLSRTAIFKTNLFQIIMSNNAKVKEWLFVVMKLKKILRRFSNDQLETKLQYFELWYKCHLWKNILCNEKHIFLSLTPKVANCDYNHL